APDTAHACRYSCQSQRDCPSGFSCGLDGVCRTSSSTWTTAAAAVTRTPAPPLDVVIADADGDGKADVFEQSQDVVTVHYDVTSSMPTDHAVARDRILPTIGPVVNFAGDSLADAVVPADLGFFVSLGTETRTERATAYSAISLPNSVTNVVPFTADVLPQEPGTENLVLADVMLSGMAPASVVIDISTVGVLSFIGFLPDSPAKLAGLPRSGKLDENTSVAPCETLVFGYTGKSSLDLLLPCKPSAGGAALVTGAETTPVPLPRGAAIAGPVTISDLDLDGHLDLLVPASRGNEFEIDVAYGRGDGTFASTPGTDPTTSADGAAGLAVSGVTVQPLAVADLDGDEQPDWVDATGVYLSRGKESPVIAAHNDTTWPWTSALVAALNADDSPDVAVGSNQAPYVASILSNGGGVFTPFTVSVPGNVTRLLSGDFDGDRIGDVAFVTTGDDSGGGTTSDTLSVLFGAPYGVPDAPKDIGEFHRITELAVGHAPAGPKNVVDGADELGALAQEEDGTLAFAIIFGRSDRKLRAPYDLTIAKINEADVVAFGPLRLVPADIDGDGALDLVSLGQNIDDDSEFRLWANPMGDQASIRTQDTTYSDPLKQGFDWSHVLIGALDLDGTPGDELAILGPRADGSGYQSAVASSSILMNDMNGAGRTYSVASPVMVDRAFTRSEQPLADASVHNGRLRIADVDGDGKKDVVALGQLGNNGSLVVFFNDGKGDLGAPAAVNGADELDVRDFAVASAPGDEKARVVLLTATGVFVVGERGRSLSVGSTPALSMTGGAVTSPSLIAAGDVDGDGVPDLAIGGALGFEIHLGISGNPLDAR
ncbi:MAG TPA: VCBS repeat-containing protein, partial [Polyangiaceae bacterium]|nr:VCBS repeat-containing protein [Polyangiaceae bacterium]